MPILYGRAGRITANNGGFWPVDQWQFTPGRDDTNGRTRDTCIPYQLQRL